MKTRTTILLLVLALGAVAGLSSCTTLTTARLDTRAEAVLDAMSDKLAAAKTLRLTATRSSSPGIAKGINAAESARGTIVVRRPNQLAARIKSNKGARSIGFDGNNLTIVDHAAGTHGIVAAPGGIDSAVKAVQATYGVTPPVAELLVNHPKQYLLAGVKTGSHIGNEKINGTECDHLAFEQDGLSWQLWVATSDSLPRRIFLSYPNGGGGAPLTMTANIEKWELDPPVTNANLSVKPPAGSRAVEMIPLSN